MPTLNGEKDLYEDHILNIKKWQEEKMQSMLRIQEAQRAKLEEERKRMDALIRGHMSTLSVPGISCEISNQLPDVKTSTSETVLIEAEPHSRTEVDVEGVKWASNSDNEKESKGEVNLISNATETFSVRPTATSFEEAIEQQLQKLQVEDVDKNATSKVKPKQPFLRKRSGLEKYTPSSASKKSEPKSTAKIAKLVPKLTLKPAIRITTGSQKGSKVHFNLPFEKSGCETVAIGRSELPVTPVCSKGQNTGVSEVRRITSGNCAVQQREDSEVAEFEILENATKIDSSDGDSHADVLQDEKITGGSQSADQTVKAMSSAKWAAYISELNSQKICLEQHLQSYDDPELDFILGSRKPHLDNATITNSDENGVIAMENKDTVNLHEKDHRRVKSSVSSSSSSSVINSDLSMSVVAVCGPDRNMLNEQQNEPGGAHSIPIPEIEEFDLGSSGSTDETPLSKLTSKSKELEEEIAICKKHEAELLSLKKKQNEEIKALQKNREEFEKFKSEELKKLHEEITEKRMQMKREKQTFERYQKLRKDMPGRKEKEETNALKQQVVALQDELKKQSLRSSAECKRLRKLLTSAEKERDTVKMENERLEELIKAKQNSVTENKVSRTAKNREPVSYADLDSDTPSEDSNLLQHPENEEKEDFPIATHENILPSDKQHVRFNLDPIVHKDGDETNYHEIHYSDRKERIYGNGQKEIYYPTGTTEYVSADGFHRKYVFYNGETKEIFPDKRMMYYYVDGTVQTAYPDGLEVFEYPDHQVDRVYPDGTKKVTFPSGHSTVSYPDGAQEQFLPNGTVIKSFADGMQTIEYPWGDKEFRTDDYVKHEYSNGTVQTIYKSGRVETRYANGRLRVRNKDGELILDVKK